MLPPRLLGLLDTDPVPAQPGDRLVRVAREVEAEVPERFLARGQGGPRAFWQEGSTWRASIGEAASVRLDPPLGSGRFDQAREKVRRWAERAIGSEGAPAGELAVVGGFAFHAEPEPDPFWDPFGTGRFAVPALTMEHGPTRTRLVGTARVRSGTDEDTAIAKAKRALDRAVERLDEPPPRGPTEYTIPSVIGGTDRTTWCDAVDEALARIRKRGFRKVVLARTLDLDAPDDPDPVVALGNLRQANPGTHVFLVEPRPGSAFLGAAPELLARVRGTTLTASAVAGSVARGETEDEDDLLARRLASSGKDRDEHEIVVRSMRDRLARLTDHVEIGHETNILRLATIQHLERDLHARLAEDQHVLDLLAELHPTPAVCGYPREPARAFLRASEPFERGLYAGPMGWFDAQGEGTFAPALRSAVLHEDRWRLFAGAGIVEGSTPEAEYEETGIKFEPVLDALGVQEVPTP